MAHCAALPEHRPIERLPLHPFDHSMDPVSLATSGTYGFWFDHADGFVAASGVAARLVLPAGLDPATAPEVAAWLAAIASSGPIDHPGTGPIALGALPFAPGRRCELVVPALVLVGDRTGRRWVTRIKRSPDASHRATPRAPGRPLGASDPCAARRPTSPALGHELRVLTEEPEGDRYERQVAEALAALAAGELTKVVLARRVTATFSTALDVASVLRGLRSREPTSTVFAQVDGDTAFVGASPELLVHRRGDQVRSHPLAGTRPLSDLGRDGLDGIVATLLAAPKDQAEHQVAAQSVAAGLAPWCHRLDVPYRPSALVLRDMVHLGTVITGQLRVVLPPPSHGRREPSPADALSLVAALHPTPAVAGAPTAAALALIEHLEGDHRDLYAGPVGWMDSRGDGTFVIGIRSATITGACAVLHAGAGIVAGSVPAEELAETTAKLGTMLGALGVPANQVGTARRSAAPARAPRHPIEAPRLAQRRAAQR